MKILEVKGWWYQECDTDVCAMMNNVSNMQVLENEEISKLSSGVIDKIHHTW